MTHFSVYLMVLEWFQIFHKIVLSVCKPNSDYYCCCLWLAQTILNSFHQAGVTFSMTNLEMNDRRSYILTDIKESID